MDWIKEKVLNIVGVFINLIFILSFLKLAYRIKGFDYLFVSFLFLLGVLIYWVYFGLINKTRYRIYLLLIILAVIILIFIKDGQLAINYIQNNYINPMIAIDRQVGNFENTYFLAYKPIFKILIPLITFILLTLCEKKLNNALLIVTLSIMLVFWYWEYVDEVKVFLVRYLFISIITYGINVYTKNLRILKQKNIKLSIDTFQTFIFIVSISLIISTVSIFLPQEYKGKYNKEMGERFVNQFSPKRDNKIGKSDIYNLSFSGYNDKDKKLGGPISINNTKVLLIESDKPYYLRGSVKDYYDGGYWTRSKSSFNEYKPKGDNETFTQEKNSTQFSVGTSSIKIYPLKLQTSTLFTVEFPYDATTSKGNIYNDGIPTLISTRLQNEEYTIKYRKSEDGIKIFENLYRNRYKYDFKEIDDWSGEKEKYEEKLKNEYSEFLQVPDVVSDEIRELVYDITKDSKTNIEKVKAIQEYLSNNYRYSLNVSEVPDDEEFINYFLFKEKKGYCTYFSTSMTIFCRIAGVPARYVEGYKMIDRKNEDGLFEVTNKEAHAWTEVLLIPYSDVWTIVDTSPTPEENTEINENSYNLENDDINEIQEERDNSRDPLQDTDFSDEKSSDINFLEWVSIIVMFLTIYILLTYVYVNNSKKKIIKNNSVLPLYQYWLKALKRTGVNIPKTLTDKEFAVNFQDLYLRTKMKNLVEQCYKEYYGNIIVENFDKKDYYEYIDNYSIEKQGKLKHYIKKYLLCWK